MTPSLGILDSTYSEPSPSHQPQLVLLLHPWFQGSLIPPIARAGNGELLLTLSSCQAPLSMGFSRQEYWSGLPFPPPGGSSRPRDQTHVSCVSCIAGRFFTPWAIEEASSLPSKPCEFYLLNLLTFTLASLSPPPDHSAPSFISQLCN